MAYGHLSQNERFMIANLLDYAYPVSEIAQMLRRSPSTISREIRRNRTPDGYHAGQADAQAQQRRWDATSRTISDHQWALIEDKIRQDWSPEQIHGWLDHTGQQPVSHEWIYEYIYRDQTAGGPLHTHLRCQKTQRKRYGTYGKRGPIPHRVSISQRPATVDTRERIGDWEGDTILGKGRSQALVSLVDRATRFTLLAKVDRKAADAVQAAIVRLLRPYPAQTHTLTLDNGPEFARHQTMTQKLHMAVYFAHPYSAWERGTNENTNGLVRQYLPKGTAFDDVTDADLDWIMHRLNTRPRKCLDYRTPAALFYGNHETSSVALRG
ncbi:MAG: IS30 family transposase [Candidatus Marinimicrobia bacterium]|nr:IS30 family transposase [Candidatus Neomarinimicrobiota bacterium]MCF7828726.1 IS30 family transposase [Candidatus Neomarinimicrobiota bacterium]MCF7880467.1 IS30 family transposase [Candidatus Neomarinimicrobiota bacterium]